MWLSQQKRKKTRLKLCEDRSQRIVKVKGFFMSSKKYEHLFSILKLGWRVLFILMLYLLLANVKFVPYHSRTIEGFVIQLRHTH